VTEVRRRTGFEAEGNEVSYFMLLVSDLLLNRWATHPTATPAAAHVRTRAFMFARMDALGQVRGGRGRV
jgi:hypothetical protein